jgi:hypothetical protein
MSYNAEYWRRRAEQMRSIAEQLTLFERAKAAILQFAEEYDRRALRADERLTTERLLPATAS